MRLLSALGVAAALIGLSIAQHSQGAAAPADPNYPSRPIRLIVPFSPGGTNDILGRMIAAHLTEVLGKTMIVDNRTGAEGIIGTEIAAKATPDGYTLIVLSSAYVMNPAVRKLPYDSLTAFEFIAKLGSSATVLCVGPSLPATSLKDVLAAAKAKPGHITLGSSGGFQHFASALFRSMSSQDFNIVLYKGAFPAMIDVMGGQLHAILIPIVPSLPHLRSGKLKGIASGTLKRSVLLPELPTLDELGMKGFDAANTYSMATAAGTSPAIVKRLYTEVSSYLLSPDTQKKLNAMGAEVDIKNGDEIRKILPVEIAKWTKVAVEAKMPRDQQ